MARFFSRRRFTRVPLEVEPWRRVPGIPKLFGAAGGHRMDKNGRAWAFLCLRLPCLTPQQKPPFHPGCYPGSLAVRSACRPCAARPTPAPAKNDRPQLELSRFSYMVRPSRQNLSVFTTMRTQTLLHLADPVIPIAKASLAWAALRPTRSPEP